MNLYQVKVTKLLPLIQNISKNFPENDFSASKKCNKIESQSDKWNGGLSTLVCPSTRHIQNQ